MVDIIDSSPEVMSGTPVFRGSRVPIQTLFDYLEDGQSIDEFLIDFPSVSRDQVVRLLERLKQEALDAA